MFEEKWALVNGSNGNYSISNMGRLRSNQRITIRKDGKRLPVKAKILKQANDSTGYKRCALSGVGTCKVHRLVALAFVPNPNNYPEVNHKDGNKANNNINNLEWVTHQQNTQHAHKNGLVNHWKKVSDLTIQTIRTDYVPNSRKFGTCALALKHGLSSSYVWRVIKGQKRKNCGRKLKEE